MTSPSATSVTLIDRIKLQDPDAWKRLVHLYGPLVYRWCVRSGLRDYDAADLGQEVFRAVFRSIGEFRRDRPKDTFCGWLRTITRNKVHNFLAARGRQELGVGGTVHQGVLAQIPSQGEPGLNEVNDSEEENALYRRAMELIRTDFEENTWRAFWRTTVDNQPAVEVAQELGMTAVAVRKAKSRVLSRLRGELGEPLEQSSA